MTKRQRALLETLHKHKSPLELETDLNEVRQEYGPYGAAAFFFEDWNPLCEKGFVTGNAKLENDTITGRGRITALGEKELKGESSED
jgi:hypothetical protein